MSAVVIKSHLLFLLFYMFEDFFISFQILSQKIKDTIKHERSPFGLQHVLSFFLFPLQI